MSSTFSFHPQIILNMMERWDIELGQVIRVLYGNQITPRKRGIIKEILPVFAFNIELFHGLIAVYVSSGPHGHNVRVFRERLEEYRAVVIILGIFEKVEFC